MEEQAQNASRRTRLAAERTWLAWWRTGLAVTVAAIGLGRIAPQLLGFGHTAYAVLGVGYALLAVGIFVAGYRRYRDVQAMLDRGGYEELPMGWVAAFALLGGALGIATLVLIVFKG